MSYSSHLLFAKCRGKNPRVVLHCVEVDLHPDQTFRFHDAVALSSLLPSHDMNYRLETTAGENLEG